MKGNLVNHAQSRVISRQSQSYIDHENPAALRRKRKRYDLNICLVLEIKLNHTQIERI